MVVDAGGGTVDITVHHNSSNGLVEIHSPSGGSWGSSYINKQFEELLEELFGREHIATFKNSKDWYIMMDTFEACCRVLHLSAILISVQSAKVKFSFEDPIARIGVSFILTEEVINRCTPRIVAFNTRSGTNIALQRGLLCLETVMPLFFDKVISNIINHVKNLLVKPELRQVQYMFLVGGLGESTILQQRIQEEFHNRLKLVVPPRPSVAVVNGAVMFGLNPSIISKRVMPLTIGMRINVLWDDKEHWGRKQLLANGRRFCAEGVALFIHAGDHVDKAHVVKREGFAPPDLDTTTIRIYIYGSSAKTFKFSSDEGVRCIGFLIMDIPDVGKPSKERIVDVEMKFGGTTFSVNAVYRKTKQSVDAKFNFLLGMSHYIIIITNFKLFYLL